MNITYFLGRFHVQILHLPIALVLLVLAFEWLARTNRYAHLRAALPALWGATAVSAVVTAGLGYLHFQEGGFDTAAGELHEWTGIAVAVVATVAWLARSWAAPLFHRGFAAVAVVLLGLITVTGHTGGTLTHGSTFLVEYGPQPLRTLAGLDAPRPPVTDLAQADPFLDVVRPILNERCASCHGAEKRKGGLTVIEHAALLQGGDSGAAVVAGDPAKSELIRRLLLPVTDVKHMPGEGRPPLADAEVRLLQWWVQAGAPVNTTVGAMQVPAEMQPVLLARVGLGGAAAGEAAAGGDAVAADQKILSALDASGFLARPVSLTTPQLRVALLSPGTRVSPQQLETLLGARQEIVELNLANAGLVDASLQELGQMSRLTRLLVQGNALTDAGVRSLAPLTTLRVLNLYGNRGVTDASVELIGALPALERVYVWDTGMSPAGIAALRRKRPTLLIDVGDTLTPEPPSPPGPPQT